MQFNIDSLIPWLDKNQKTLLSCDYDGTLVPIASKPDLATPGAEVIRVLQRLSSIDYLRLAVISGRTVTDLKILLPINNMIYVGNHGADIFNSELGHFSLLNENTVESCISEIGSHLQNEIAFLHGILLENKGTSLSLHYRLASLIDAKQATRSLIKIVKKNSNNGLFRLVYGKQVIELIPNGVSKARAIRMLLDIYSIDKTRIIYFGDDTSDEEAFQNIGSNGFTVLVSPFYQASYAKFRLKSSAQVIEFLSSLSNFLEG